MERPGFNTNKMNLFLWTAALLTLYVTLLFYSIIRDKSIVNSIIWGVAIVLTIIASDSFGKTHSTFFDELPALGNLIVMAICTSISIYGLFHFTLIGEDNLTILFSSIESVIFLLGFFLNLIFHDRYTK